MIAMICLLIAAISLYCLYPEVKPLTLCAAWYWAVAAWWSLAALVAIESLSIASVAFRSAVSYFCATMMLAPLVAVLGARRPGANAWPWFVVLPMIVVLQWPGLTQLVASQGREPIEIGTPALMGVLAVLVMGCGNYLGTRNTLAAAMIAVSVGILLIPVLGLTPRWHRSPLLATVPTAIASVLAMGRFLAIRTLSATSEQQAADRLWIMFRDTFGIVWARRVMDRVNQFADREHWTARLTMDGFASPAPPANGTSAAVSPSHAEGCSEQLQRPLEILCWILQRFAGPEWLRQQLGAYAPSTSTES